MAEVEKKHALLLENMKGEMKQMYLDMRAECEIKTQIADNLCKKVKNLEDEIARMFKMLHYPRMVEEMKRKSI